MGRLKWFFDLQERVTGPARRIHRTLDRVNDTLRQVRSGTEVTEKALAKSFGLSERSAGRLAGAFRMVGTASGALGVARSRAGDLWRALSAAHASVFNLRNLLIGGVVGGTVGLAGKGLIDQVGFVEQQRIALSTLLDDPIRGQTALEWAIKFADKTPFETPDVLQAVRQSLAMGFSTRQIEPLLTTLGDTASALALGPSGLNELIQVFGQIRSAGKLMTEDVYQLTGRGIPAFEILAKAFKTDIPKVRKMIELGQISSDAALRVFHEDLKARFGGGMERQSRSILGLVSTLRSRPQLLAFGLEKGKAAEPLRQLLANLADLTDFSKPPGSAIGKHLEAGLGSLFKAAFGPLAVATEPKAAAVAIETFLNRATAAVERARAIWPGLKAAALDLFAGVRIAVDALAGLWRRVEPVLGFVSRLTGSFGAVQAGLTGTDSPAIRLAATLLTLAAAWRILNLVTLGGAGTLARWSAVAGVLGVRAAARLAQALISHTAARSTLVMDVLTDPRGRLPALRDHLARLGRGVYSATAQVVSAGVDRLNALWGSLRALGGRAFTAVARVSVLGLSAVWAGIRTLAVLGLTALRTSGQALLAGGRMAVAWLIGLGPIGWIIAAVGGVGAALVLAYKRVGWFRDAVNTAWTRIQQAGKGLLDWFTSLPERIGNAFGRLPDLLRGLLRRAIDLLPPGVRDVVKGLVGGLLGGQGEVQHGAEGMARATETGFTKPLQIHSPSRRFTYLGRMLGAGLEAGALRSLTRVRQAASLLAGAAAVGAGLNAPSLPPAAGVPQSPTLSLSVPQAPGGRSISITVGPIHVQGGSKADAERVAQEVRAVAVEAVLEALERAAMEEGA